VIFQVIDDHSRMILASLGATSETCEAAIQVVRTAIKRWGVPQKFLSDNGAALNPTRRGYTNQLVDYLQTLGVTPITGKPGKPTTQGKDERVHRTLIKWLNARPAAPDLSHLQTLVEDHDDYYNHQREHQSLAGRTPFEAWLATDLADEPAPSTTPTLPAPPPSERVTVTKTVHATGRINILGCEFHIGKATAHHSVHIVYDATTVEVFDDTGLSIRRYPRPTPGTRHIGPRKHRPTTMS
jgi:hypothetical protein